MLTRRQCYFLFCSGLATAFLSRPGYADHNVDVTATVINNTCRLEVNDNGVVRLPTVKLDYFSNEITAETDYAGGKTLLCVWLIVRSAMIRFLRCYLPFPRNRGPCLRITYRYLLMS